MSTRIDELKANYKVGELIEIAAALGVGKVSDLYDWKQEPLAVEIEKKESPGHMAEDILLPKGKSRTSSTSTGTTGGTSLDPSKLICGKCGYMASNFDDLRQHNNAEHIRGPWDPAPPTDTTPPDPSSPPAAPAKGETVQVGALIPDLPDELDLNEAESFLRGKGYYIFPKKKINIGTGPYGKVLYAEQGPNPDWAVLVINKVSPLRAILNGMRLNFRD